MLAQHLDRMLAEVRGPATGGRGKRRLGTQVSVGQEGAARPVDFDVDRPLGLTKVTLTR